MTRINDRDETRNTAAENNRIERTSNPGSERGSLADVEATDAGVRLPHVERAAAMRELVSSLRRATAAAERLAELVGSGAVETTAKSKEGFPRVPQVTATLPPPFAVRSDGRMLFNVEACPDLNLRFRDMFLGIVLTEGEEAFARRKLEHIVHDVAGHLGGMIKRCEPGEGSGSDGNK